MSRNASSALVLSLDAMGGDHGPPVVIAGAARALERLSGRDVRFLVHGDQARIEAELKKTPRLSGRVEIRLVGDYFDETLSAAQVFTKETGALFLPPFDDADVIEGQATCALEIFEELPAPDLLVVPVGGGGLASGMVQVADTLAPSAAVRLVEPAGGASLRALRHWVYRLLLPHHPDRRLRRIGARRKRDHQ